jgi:GAF domain-containing protein
VEPIQETRDAIDELDPMEADDDLLEQLVATGTRVRALVPACVGMSVSMLLLGVTFTLVATREELASVPSRGSDTPAREARSDAEEAGDGGMGELAWQDQAGSTAASGIASTLTLPVLRGDRAIGSVALYGAAPHCFDGHHEALAAMVGAWAEGAVTNADLSFSSRETAEQAPGVLRDQAAVDLAVGLLAGTLGLDVDTARSRLVAASLTTGTDSAQVARVVLELLTDQRR